MFKSLDGRFGWRATAIDTDGQPPIKITEFDEAVGISATFALCQEIIAPGGVIANIGVHGAKVELHLENLWDRNISITTRHVDTVSTPMLLEVLRAKKIDARRLITHRFDFAQIIEAYDTFGNAAKSKTLKVMISM